MLTIDITFLMAFISPCLFTLRLLLLLITLIYLMPMLSFSPFDRHDFLLMPFAMPPFYC